MHWTQIVGGVTEFFKQFVPNVIQHMNHLNKKFSFPFTPMEAVLSKKQSTMY